MSTLFEQLRKIMQFDLAEVPFSRFGSYMAIDHLPASAERAAGIYVRTLHGDASCAEICRIDLLHNNDKLLGNIHATPSLLRIDEGVDYLEICFADENTLRLRGNGIGMRLIFNFALYDSALQWREGWLINSFSNRMRYALFVRDGVLRSELIAAESRCVFDCMPDASGLCEIAFTETPSRWPQPNELFGRDFSVCQCDVAREFKQWLQATPSVSSEFSATRELAAYVQWSSVVSVQGNFQRPAMLMSKHWLNAVWSWDHCFNALALFKSNPALAWDQFMLLFDYQNKHGALPDCISDKTFIWNFCKPPIHGWTLRWMLRNSGVTRTQLQEVYAPLSRWAEWWLTERVDLRDQKRGDGLPQYFHGNDSGWDNASVFDAGLPVLSPDLAAFLILQMDALAEVAQRLEQSRAEQQWRERADALLEKMLARLWRNNRSIALHNDQSCGGDSLLLLLPIALGERLPKAIQQELIAALKQENRFLTEHGLASESVSSPRYEGDGYWRGPMWAPVVFLIVEGLRALNEKAFADEIARRFCATVARSGVAENFDALTGAGLRDRAHTWTASVFLLLAHSLENGESK